MKILLSRITPQTAHIRTSCSIAAGAGFRWYTAVAFVNTGWQSLCLFPYFCHLLCCMRNFYLHFLWLRWQATVLYALLDFRNVSGFSLTYEYHFWSLRFQYALTCVSSFIYFFQIWIFTLVSFSYKENFYRLATFRFRILRLWIY